MQMAGSERSFAVATAAKRGLPNGEAEGAKAHPEAKAEYDAFLNEQAEHPTGGK